MDQPSRQVCPTCGLPPARTATHTADGINTASLACPLDHVWLIRWAEQQHAQAAEVAA